MADQTTEELEKQRQQQAQMQAEWQKQMKLQQMQQIIMSTDPATVLKTMAGYQGITLFCNNPWVSVQLLNTIYNDLFKGAIEDDTLKSIADALNRAIQYTNQRRMNFGMGMNPMMGGMGMMPGMGMMGGMNMMGMGMPGMGMMNPMMMGGMGMMNPMGMMGMQQPQQQKTDGSDNIAAIKQFIEMNLKPTNVNYAVDPLVFLQVLISSGIDIDFSEDKQFSQLCSNAIICAIYGMDNWNFNSTYCVILSIYQSNYQQQWAEAQKKNGNNTQNNMMGMMNPMMGMMPGMGMNMGVGMPMGMGMGMMPGMNNFGGVQNNTGCIW